MTLTLAGRSDLRVRDNGPMDLSEQVGVVALEIDDRYRDQTATVTIERDGQSRTTAILLAQNATVDLNGEGAGRRMSVARAVNLAAGIYWGIHLTRYFGGIATQQLQNSNFNAKDGSDIKPDALGLGASFRWMNPFANWQALSLGVVATYMVSSTLARGLALDRHPDPGIADVFLGYDMLWRLNPYLAYQFTRAGMNAAPMTFSVLLGFHITRLKLEGIADESQGGGMRNASSDTKTLLGPSLGLELLYRTPNRAGMVLRTALMFDYLRAQTLNFQTNFYNYGLRADAAWVPIFMLTMMMPF